MSRKSRRVWRACKRVWRRMPSRPKLKLQTGFECDGIYYPASDTMIVEKNFLLTTPHYFAQVFFHELAHSTGHPDRLNRELLSLIAANGYFETASPEALQKARQEESLAHSVSQHFLREFDFSCQWVGKAIKNWSSALNEEEQEQAKAAAAEAIDYIIGNSTL